MEFVECVLVGVGVATFCFYQNSFVTHVEKFLDKQVCTVKADPFLLQILTCFMASIVFVVIPRSERSGIARSNRRGMIFKHCAKCVQQAKIRVRFSVRF